jgi:hypothetical protein
MSLKFHAHNDSERFSRTITETGHMSRSLLTSFLLPYSQGHVRVLYVRATSTGCLLIGSMYNCSAYSLVWICFLGQIVAGLGNYNATSTLFDLRMRSCCSFSVHEVMYLYSLYRRIICLLASSISNPSPNKKSENLNLRQKR